jgi:hypothetical protein
VFRRLCGQRRGRNRRVLEKRVAADRQGGTEADRVTYLQRFDSAGSATVSRPSTWLGAWTERSAMRRAGSPERQKFAILHLREEQAMLASGLFLLAFSEEASETGQSLLAAVQQIAGAQGIHQFLEPIQQSHTNPINLPAATMPTHMTIEMKPATLAPAGNTSLSSQVATSP